MMILLDGRHFDDSFIYYLQDGNVCTVGRKDTDIVITKDKSVSRKHAQIKANNDHALVTDCDARYCTYIDNAKLEANVPTIARHGSAIKFGGFESIIKIEVIPSLLVCCSGFSVSKTNLLQQLNAINAKFSQTWSKDCTHMTVERYKLTPKVLCALIENQHVVNLNFWKAYVEAVQRKKELPKPEDYKPPLAETSLDNNTNLIYKPERRTLFKDIIFVFNSAQILKEMKDLLKATGGDSILFENLNLSKEDVLKSSTEYIFIQETSNSQMMQDFQTYIQYMKENGRYSIPVIDIGLAIVYCSRDKHANTRLNKAELLLRKRSQQTERNFSQVKELAPATQTQLLQPPAVNLKEEMIIEESLHIGIIPPIDDSEIQNILPTITSTPSVSGQNKRKEQPMEIVENENVKKIKVEIDEKSTVPFIEPLTETLQKPDRKNPFAAKLVSGTSGKKRTGENLTQPTTKKSFIDTTTSLRSTKSEKVVNPFSKTFKSIKKSNDTINDNNQEESNSSNLSRIESTVPLNVRPLSQAYCDNFDWISKCDVDKVQSIKKVYNQDVQSYVDSFKDIEWEITIISSTLLPRDRSMDVNISNKCYVGKVNYKKFKKVQPKHPQRNIVPTRNDKFINVENDEI